MITSTDFGCSQKMFRKALANLEIAARETGVDLANRSDGFLRACLRSSIEARKVCTLLMRLSAISTHTTTP